MLGEQIARSKEQFFLVGEWRYVDCLLLNKHKSFSAIKFSIITPLSFVSEKFQFTMAIKISQQNEGPR